MLKVRVIPVLFLMNGLIVRSETFSDFKVIGNPYSELERYSEWMADELVYVDITREGGHDLRRNDLKVSDQGDDVIAILRQISRHAFMPLTFGGRVATLDQVDEIIRNGADKVLINSAAHRTPALVTQVAEKYGAQAMVAGIDVRRIDGRPVVHIDQGRVPVDDDVVGYARQLEALGAGEILVNSIDRDGTAAGYDLDLIGAVAAAVGVPVVACGGVGTFGQMAKGVTEAGASALAAGNIFHFTENSYKRAKKTLREKGVPVRYPYAG